MLTVNFARTLQRQVEAKRYLQNALGNGELFTCPFVANCQNSCSAKHFYVDQRPHIGDHYDIHIDGEPQRIVVIGQEYGTSDQFVSVDDRTHTIHACGDHRFGKRNPHMRGTTSILRLLLGKGLGSDAEGERLGVGEAHLFQGFSLVNALMCSAIDRSPSEESGSGSAQGRASATMFKNCSNHLRALLQILEPTVVVVQGTNHKIVAAVSLALDASLLPGRQCVEVAGRDAEVLIIPHPSAPSYGWWGRSAKSRYLLDQIVPLIGNVGGRSASALPNRDIVMAGKI